MSESAAGWLVQLALGGGLLLLAAWLVMRRVPAPAARQRLGEMGVLSALLLAALALGPRWLPIRLPAWMAPAAPAVAQASEVAPSVESEQPRALVEGLPGPPLDPPPAEAPAAVPLPEATASVPAPKAPTAAHWGERIETALITAYAVVAGLFLLRWLLAHAALAWLLRGAKPAPRPVAALLEELYAERASSAQARSASEETSPCLRFGLMSPRARVPLARSASEELSPCLRVGLTSRRVRLVVSPRVRVPFSCGLFRPTMVLPENLAEAPPRVLRWVLAHERAHLERRDGGSGVLLALGQAAFFFVPWFWWLRRQVRLCQEYVADAAAVAAGGRPEDYAEFLIGWVAAPAAPMVCNGVFGSSSDLYQRISMLLQAPAAQGNVSSGRWLIGTAAGLLSLAVVLAGLYVQPRAVAEAVAPPPAEPVEKTAPPVVDKAPVEDLRRQLDELNHQIEAARKQMEKQLEAMRPPLEIPSLPVALGRLAVSRNPRLGAQVRPPESALSAQLDLPAGRGMILEVVERNSPAARAGLKSHDILLELAGKPVSSNPAVFAHQLQQVKADAPVDAVVLRKGKRETIKDLSLPEARADATADVLINP